MSPFITGCLLNSSGAAGVFPSFLLFLLLILPSLKVFNSKTAELLSHHQVEIKQSFPKEG